MSAHDATAPAPGDAARVTWVYSLSHADLKRLLPRLVAPTPLTIDGTRMTAVFADGRALQIELGPETERLLGSIRLRSTEFSWLFKGWTACAQSAFLTRCAQGLQQGGG